MTAIRYALLFPEAVEQLVLANPIGLEDWQGRPVRRLPFTQGHLGGHDDPHGRLMLPPESRLAGTITLSNSITGTMVPGKAFSFSDLSGNAVGTVWIPR
jgi:hypothetical protein